MLGIRDGIDADRFSSAMVVEGEGEGEGEGAKKPKSHSMSWHRGELDLNVPHFGNPQPSPTRAERRGRESVNFLQVKQSGDPCLLFTRSAIQLKAKRGLFLPD